MLENMMLLKNKINIMGILNVTPDSFSDGGKFACQDAAIEQAMLMLAEGADIIDIGGESTRPGANDVTVADEIKRVVPVIAAIRAISDCTLSIDTSKPDVMREAINAGANIINDVRALQEKNAIEAALELNVPVCLMHMQGHPRSMQSEPIYKNAVLEVKQFLSDRIEACLSLGMSKENIWVDPGFGFGKTLQHNLELFRAIPEFVEMGYPVVVGVSRKSMIGQILNDDSTEQSVNQRVYASTVMAAIAAQQGAQVLRVHDVKATADAIAVVNSLR